MGFIVRKSKSAKQNYYLAEELWKPKRTERVVPRDAAVAAGFRSDMTYEQAKKRASELNALKQTEVRKNAAISRRVREDRIVSAIFVPDDLRAGFEAELAETYHDNPTRLNNVLKQWAVARRIVSELKLDPKDFFVNRTKIHLRFSRQARPWSPDYIKKILWVMNLWGAYISRERKAFYQPVPGLSDTQLVLLR